MQIHTDFKTETKRRIQKYHDRNTETDRRANNTNTELQKGRDFL